MPSALNSALSSLFVHLMGVRLINYLNTNLNVLYLPGFVECYESRCVSLALEHRHTCVSDEQVLKNMHVVCEYMRVWVCCRKHQFVFFFIV